MVDHQEPLSKGGIEDLSDELKAKLDEAYDRVEQAYATEGGPAVHAMVSTIVGASKVHLAASYLSSIRAGRIRKAATDNGFRVAI